MASKSNDNPAPATEAEVRRFLIWKSPDALNRWLEEADPASANAALYEIAKSAWHPYYSLWMLLGCCLFIVLVFPVSVLVSYFLRDSPLHVRPNDLMPAVFILLFNAIRSFKSDRIGTKAAVLLAERNAEGFLPPMARIWCPWGKKPLLTAAGEANFERRLAAAHEQPDPSLIKDLRGMLRRAFPWRLQRSQRDFTEVQADILLAALRCVAKAGGDKNEKILRRIAGFSVPANASNRALIRSIAQTFLTPENPVIVPSVSVVNREASAANIVTLRRP